MQTPGAFNVRGMTADAERVIASPSRISHFGAPEPIIPPQPALTTSRTDRERSYVPLLPRSSPRAESH
jgi:hypothetical protein